MVIAKHSADPAKGKQKKKNGVPVSSSGGGESDERDSGAPRRLVPCVSRELAPPSVRRRPEARIDDTRIGEYIGS